MASHATALLPPCPHYARGNVPDNTGHAACFLCGSAARI
jgi:hypothetical protein